MWPRFCFGRFWEVWRLIFFISCPLFSVAGDYCTRVKLFPSSADVKKDPEIDANILGEYTYPQQQKHRIYLCYVCVNSYALLYWFCLFHRQTWHFPDLYLVFFFVCFFFCFVLFVFYSLCFCLLKLVVLILLSWVAKHNEIKHYFESTLLQLHNTTVLQYGTTLPLHYTTALHYSTTAKRTRVYHVFQSILHHTLILM